MTSDGHPSNKFWNHRRIGNEVGQQNVHDDLHVYQNPSDASSHLLTPLPTAPQAACYAYDSRHDGCLEGTRADLLKEIEIWAEGTDERAIVWLNGWAGTGRSTTARTLALRYHEQNRLSASFLFSRDQEDRPHAGKVFTSIATQLAEQNALLKKYICEAVAEYRDIAHHSLRDQWIRLILRPLNECVDENDVRGVIQLFAEAKGLGKGRLRHFLTNRQETSIRLGLGEIPGDQYHDSVLQSISSSMVDQDILIYFGHALKAPSSLAQWPSEAELARLVEQAEGLFIWAATACRFIKF
ncbi:MAG: hypothetical protein M1828_007025 [Chrysothrix sp. TS-e1954]|nr:MAG: hypothetical protein M1828_007025 [Chrysothrix sp. TS-e1954]